MGSGCFITCCGCYGTSLTPQTSLWRALSAFINTGPTFDGERRFSTWLYTIATNLARDRHRWRDRRPEVSLENENAETGQSLREHLPEPNADPSESLVVKERGDLVRQAVSALPEDLRVPLVLSAYEEQSHAEIGTVLGCTAKAVEMKLYRARQELRKRLALVFAV